MEAGIDELVSRMTLEEKIALTTGQDFWSTASVERLGIPSIWLNDGPHGVRRPRSGGDIGIGDAKKATCFPTAAALASSWDTGLIGEVAKALARECHALDVQILLGPGINIKRTPLCGRNFEYFSEDPVLSGKMAVAFVKALQAEGIGACVKHYACNNQEFERMTISAEVDERTLRELYLSGFERVVQEAGPWAIMASYNRVNGVAATENSRLLTAILKREWGFEGIVVSDWTAVNCKHKSLRAGLDLEMPGKGGEGDEIIAQMVRSGRLDEETLDEAVRRILKIVRKAAKHRREGASFDPEAHHALARRAAGESIVLLKNEGDLLPLDRNTIGSLAVIGRFARDPRYQGAGSSQVNPIRLDNAYDEIARLLGGNNRLVYADGYPDDAGAVDQAQLEAAVKAARAAEAAVIFAGLPPRYESEGFDREHLDLPPAHNRLIEAVCRVQQNCVVVLHNGSAVTMPWVERPRAILEGWLGGQASGGAIADVLFGAVNPSGKLSETFPLRLEDTPAYLNYPGEADQVRYGEGLFVGYKYYEKKKIAPLFPFGFGLSYTTFTYSDLAFNRETFTDREPLKVALKVLNSGRMAGREIVQLYLRDEESRLVRPEKELKAFTKVQLEPGEVKTVEFTLEAKDFAYYDSGTGAWFAETGWFEVLIGSSSADIKLTGKVYLNSTQRQRKRYHKLVPFKYFLEDPAARAVIEQELGDTPLFAVLLSGTLDGTLTALLSNMPVIKLLGYTAGSVTAETLEQVITRINSAG